MVAEIDTTAILIVEQIPDEAAAEFARLVHERLGMTSDEFLRDLDAGRWDAAIDDPKHRDALILAVTADVVRS